MSTGTVISPSESLANEASGKRLSTGPGATASGNAPSLTFQGISKEITDRQSAQEQRPSAARRAHPKARVMPPSASLVSSMVELMRATQVVSLDGVSGVETHAGPASAQAATRPHNAVAKSTTNTLSGPALGSLFSLLLGMQPSAPNTEAGSQKTETIALRPAHPEETRLGTMVGGKLTSRAVPDVEYSTPLAEMQSISNKGVQPSVVEKSSADDVEKSTYRTGRMDLSVTLPYARADFVVEQSKNRQRLAVSGENRVVSDGVESVRFRLLTTNSRRNMAEHASVSWARSLAGTATTHTYAALDSASKNTDALNAGTQPAMGVAQPGLVAVNDGEAQAVVPQQISSPVLHLGGTGWPSVLAGQVARLTVGHSMVIRVHPERLGPIEVRATQGVGGLAIHLTVTHPQVEQILQQNIGMVASQIQVMQTTPSAPVSVSVQMNAALASGFGSMGGNPENHQGTPYTASAGQTFSSTDSMEIPTDAADAGNVVTTDVRFFESWV